MQKVYDAVKPAKYQGKQIRQTGLFSNENYPAFKIELIDKQLRENTNSDRSWFGTFGGNFDCKDLDGKYLGTRFIPVDLLEFTYNNSNNKNLPFWIEKTEGTGNNKKKFEIVNPDLIFSATNGKLSYIELEPVTAN